MWHTKKILKKIIFAVSVMTSGIVKIDSRTQSFYLCHYVQNSLSYLCEET